jgi:hypothetical protein
MLRSLARVYYYFVVVAMLVLAAVGLGILLSQVLRYTPLNADNPLPTPQELTQAEVFAVVFWLIAGVLGGLHYFLIRRDLATDPGAGAGGVRSFFLNAAEFVAGWVGISAAASGLSLLGAPRYPYEQYLPSAAPPIASAAAAYFIVVLAELERRRTQTGRGAPIIFQRLHFYAIQFIVLIYTMVYLFMAVQTTLQTTIFASTINTCEPTGPDGQQFCPQLNVLGPWATFIFCVALFGVYWLLSRRDTGSALRQVQQLLGLAAGSVELAFGLYGLLNLLLSAALSAPAQNGQFEQALVSILPQLVVGALTAAVYVVWVWSERGVSRMGSEATILTVAAVLAAVGAVFFWVGIYLNTHRVAEILTNPSFQSNTYDWAGPAAAALTGALYIPISLYLRRVTGSTGVNGPRRAFVLALLASGILTIAIGGGIALVTALTAALGSPLDTSGESTRLGTALLLTGLALAALYGWSAVSEHLFGARSAEPAGAPASVSQPQAPASVEAVLDDLLAGRLTREEAAMRVREAARAGG